MIDTTAVLDRTTTQAKEAWRQFKAIKHKGLFVRMAGVAGVFALLYLVILSIFQSFVLIALGSGAETSHPWVVTCLAVILTGVAIGLQYWWGVRGALDSVDARELTRTESPEIHQMTDELCATMDIEKPQLMVAPLGTPNAFAVGRRENGTVVLGEELLSVLDTDEVEGVIAHELAHIKHRDSILMTLTTSIRRLIVFFAGVMVFITITTTAMLVEAVASDENRSGTDIPWEKLSAVFVGATLFITTNVILLFSLALSRYREFIADSTAAEAIGNPDGLTSALRKIEASHANVEAEPNRTVNALCIFGSSQSFIANLFASHPSMDKRIAKLEAYYKN